MSSGHLRWDLLDIKKKNHFSSKLKCLHYSNTNGRNYNIIVIIIIIIIHLGLSPVQYNNKQNPFFFKILLLETLLNVKCIYLHKLGTVQLPVPSLPLSVSHSRQFTVRGHCRLSLFRRGIWGRRRKEKKRRNLIKYHNFL